MQDYQPTYQTVTSLLAVNHQSTIKKIYWYDDLTEGCLLSTVVQKLLLSAAL